MTDLSIDPWATALRNFSSADQNKRAWDEVQRMWQRMVKDASYEDARKFGKELRRMKRDNE